MDILKRMLQTILNESTDVQLTSEQETAVKKGLEAINKKSKSKIKVGKQLSARTNRDRTTTYVDYEIDSPDLGIFHHIISDVILTVEIWDAFAHGVKDGAEPGRVGMRFSFNYSHHNRGSNGYEIGYVWVEKDGKIFQTKLTSDK